MQSQGFSTANSQTQQVNNAEIQQRADAMKKLMLGPGTSEMNLRAVKERGLALRKSIEEMTDLLQLHPELLTWENTVERFGVITARHQQLTEQLRPLTKFYIARPLSVNQSNAEVIPLLLSTMKLPEMEKEENETLSLHQQNVAAEGLVQLYERLGNTMDSFNKIVEDITRPGGSEVEPGYLNPRGAQQQNLSTQLKQAIESGPQKVGPDETPEAQALLAAALTGEGLAN